MNKFFIIFIVSLLGCSKCNKEVSKQETKIDSATVIPMKPIILIPLYKKQLQGDFDGDGITDTIYQDNINSITGNRIDSFPDPEKNEWDTTVKYFYKNHSDVILTISSKKTDTLHLGTAIGLYCLLNMGDNNGDGKDEIAFIVDYNDFSNYNSCRIFSLCNNKWVELNTFGINEAMAYSYKEGEKPPNTENSIPGFLEKKNGKWLYMDYDEYVRDTTGEVGVLKKLKINSCR